MRKFSIDKELVLTDDVVDELLDDWFDRDGETFVKKRKTDRLGWEADLEDEDPYSSFLLEAPTKADLIKRAYPMARDMILVMEPPFKFQVRISPKEGSYTDGKMVCVSTKMFDDPEITVGEKLDTFLGLAVHEGGHLVYTNLKVLKNLSHSSRSEQEKNVLKHIWNTIEDERMETMIGEHKPGLANFLEKTKYYYFDQYYLDYVVPMEKKMEEEGKPIKDFDRAMSIFLYAVRYPKYLKENDIIYFGRHLKAVKEVMDDFPIDSFDSMECAEAVFEIFKDFFEELAKEKKSSGGGDSSKDDDEGDGEGEGTPMTPEELAKEVEKTMGEGEAMLRALDKSISAPTEKDVADGEKKSLSYGDISDEVKKGGGLLGEVCEGTVELGSKEDTYVEREKDYESMYEVSLSRVKRYVPAIAKVLKGHAKEYKFIHRSMRSGLLDTNKLAEAVQGVPTVYTRQGEVKTDKVSVALLIDESGSMSGSRIQAARDVAVLINEALKLVPNVELFIYGHSGDQRGRTSTELYVYREKGYTPKFSLGNVSARSQNRDGIAILETAVRVRKQTKNPVLMFILSDGAPAASGYGGSSAMAHVRDNVRKVEKMNMNVIQVCINHSYDPGLMFKNYVILEDMSTLALSLGKSIKKAVLNNSKTHVL